MNRRFISYIFIVLLSVYSTSSSLAEEIKLNYGVVELSA